MDRPFGGASAFVLAPFRCLSIGHPKASTWTPFGGFPFSSLPPSVFTVRDGKVYFLVVIEKIIKGLRMGGTQGACKRAGVGQWTPLRQEMVRG